MELLGGTECLFFDSGWAFYVCRCRSREPSPPSLLSGHTTIHQSSSQLPKIRSKKEFSLHINFIHFLLDKAELLLIYEYTDVV